MAKFAGQVLGRILTLLGWDGTEFRNVLVNDAGRLQVDGITVSTPEGIAIEARQSLGAGTIRGVVSLDTHALGQINLTSSAVPAGKAWLITNIATANYNTLVPILRVRVEGDDGTIMVQEATNWPKDKWCCWSGQLWMWESDVLIAAFYQTAVDDSLRLLFNGYVIDL